MAELKSTGRKVVSILRDRRGGETNNLTLQRLREEVEQGITDHDDGWRSSSCSWMDDLFSV